MSPEPKQLWQFEGEWDELIRHPNQFAGQRVRVTVIPENNSGSATLVSKIRSWLAEGEALTIAPPADSKPDIAIDGLVEKFRSEGLLF